MEFPVSARRAEMPLARPIRDNVALTILHTETSAERLTNKSHQNDARPAERAEPVAIGH